MKDPNTKAEDVMRELAALGNPQVAVFFLGFFQAGPGGYGEGDSFRGIRIPAMRLVARKYRGLPFPEAKRLLASKFHEDRIAALEILIHLFAKGDGKLKEKIYLLYAGSARHINNWDLVDGSAPHILGAWLEDKPKSPLYKLARSKNLWERRMAMIATLRYIRKGRFEEALRIAEMLIEAPEDLLHKASGWMLREIGKRDRGVEEAFLASHYRRMPRTMLRYAIEHFPEPRRQAYLKGKA